MAGKDTHSSCKSNCLYSTCCAAPRDRMCSRYKIYFPRGRWRSIERQRQSAPPVDTEETHWAVLEAFKCISLRLKWSSKQNVIKAWRTLIALTAFILLGTLAVQRNISVNQAFLLGRSQTYDKQTYTSLWEQCFVTNAVLFYSWRQSPNKSNI